ncbi:MAG: hypothetical protein AAFV85_27245, partial [Cyanobacteria bacterium J06634_6]
LFADESGEKLMFKGDRESMTALEKGRNHIRNAELRVTGMQSLIDYWQDYQRQSSSMRVVSTSPPQEPEKYSPPPVKNWARSILAARYKHAG